MHNERLRERRKYSGIPISRTLSFSNLPITRTKSRSPSSVKHCSFTPDFSNSSIFRTNFCFPWRFVKSGFHCNSEGECETGGDRVRTYEDSGSEDDDYGDAEEERNEEEDVEESNSPKFKVAKKRSSRFVWSITLHFNTFKSFMKLFCYASKVLLKTKFERNRTEHKRATRNGDASNHIAAHHQLTNHNIDWDPAQCLTYSTNYFQRLTLESWYANLE